MSRELREALAWLVKNADGIKSDVAAGHNARRHDASEWMREDDSDFRSALDKHLAALSQAPDGAITALQADNARLVAALEQIGGLPNSYSSPAVSGIVKRALAAHRKESPDD